MADRKFQVRFRRCSVETCVVEVTAPNYGPAYDAACSEVERAEWLLDHVASPETIGIQEVTDGPRA